MPARPDISLLHRYKKWSNYFAWAVMGMAILVLSGWQFNIDWLKRPAAYLTPMHPFAAISFVFCGVSFLLLANTPVRKYHRLAGRILAVLVLPAALVKTMTVSAMLCFVFGSSALLLLHYETRRHRAPVQYLALFIFFISFFSILGYLYKVPEFYRQVYTLPMALYTAVNFLFFSLAVLFARPATGMMSLFTGKLEGSLLSRVLIPACLFVPALLGGLRVVFNRLFPVSVELGVTLLTMAIILVFSGLMWININLINKRDLKQKKAENKFRGLLEAAPDAIVIADDKGLIQLVNAQTEKMFGYNRSELIGEKIELLMPGKYRDTHTQHRTRYSANPRSRGMGEGLELFGRKKDGAEFFVEISLSPLETEEGILVSAAIRDISDRKQLETKLKQFNKELELEVQLKTSELTDMLDRIGDSFLAFDTDFRYTYLNKRMVVSTGKDLASIIGRPVWEIIPNATEWPVYQAARKAMEEQTYITTTWYDNRQNRWQENHIYPSPRGVSIFIRDITERKKAEEQQNLLASIVDSTDVAIISKTLDGIITSWNHGAEVLFGFTARETIGKHITLVFSNDLSNEESFIQKKISKGEYVDEYETDRKRKDGLIINISLTVYPIRSPEGKIVASSQIARNITERKKAEARVREAERRYQSTLDSMIEGCQIIDFTWRYLYINPVAAHQGHSEPGKLLGRTMMEVYPGIDKTTLFSILKKCMENRTTEQIENEFVFGDESSRWFELRIQPSPEGLFILSIDITERKKSEEKIQGLIHEIAQSERRFRGMIENNNDLVVLSDEHFKPFYRSPNFQRITGWTPTELDQQGPDNLIHPDDLVALRKTFEPVLKNPGKSFPVSFRLRHKDGHHIWMEGITTNLLQEESIKGIVANLRDVSQRKEDEIKVANSERIYKTIASSIPGSAIILFDKQHRYLLIEGDLLPGFGFKNEQLLGRLAGEALPQEVYMPFKTRLDRVFKGESFTQESNTGKIDAITRYVPIRNEKEVSFAMLVVIDITELKNTQRSLADLNRNLELKVEERTEQLAIVNRELEAFTYSVSHDLRAPLRIIDGFADILVSDYAETLDEEGNRNLHVIKSNAQRMGKLIDDLLNLSRLGRKELLITHVNMENLVHAVIEEQQMLNKFKVAIVCEQLMPVRCDSNLLRQVWSNLISNAVKYSGKKTHPEITIGSHENGHEVIYHIKDNGVGFDMQYAGKLFGVFQRLHKQTEFEGTGVGLALVQRIVNKHGGKIWASSEPGKGATFSFSLPKTR